MVFKTVAKETRAWEALPFRSWQQSNRGSSFQRSNEAVRQKVAALKNPEELQGENEVLRDRLSRLSAAVLRVSASLDMKPSCRSSSRAPAG